MYKFSASVCRPITLLLFEKKLVLRGRYLNCILVKEQFPSRAQDIRYASSLQRPDLIRADEAAKVLDNLNDIQKENLEYAKIEYERLQGQLVESPNNIPAQMKNEWWATLAVLGNSKGKRMKLFNELRKIETKYQKKDEKTLSERKLKLDTKPGESGDVQFKKRHENRLFLMMKKHRQLMIWHSNVALAMIHARPLVIDMGYDVESTYQGKLSEQLLEGYLYNERKNYPYHLVCTNFNDSDYVYKNIHHMISLRHQGSRFMATTTEKSYLDLYPKKNLVYLSPDAKKILKKDNPNNIYIIGGHWNKGLDTPLSLQKASSEKITCASLPIDQYVLWKQGSKSLKVDVMVKIMTDFMDTNDWKTAFQHIPPGCIHDKESIIKAQEKAFSQEFMNQYKKKAL